jgi:hypothetical protein
MSDQKLFLRTWPLAAVTGIVVSVVAALAMPWRLDSPESLTTTLVATLLSGLFITIARSKGKFRMQSILVLMILVGIASATVGRRVKRVQSLRALARSIVEHGGTMSLAGGSSLQSDGWLLTRGGYAIPAILKPINNYFY